MKKTDINRVRKLGDKIRHLVTPFGSLAQSIYEHKYQHEECDRDWADTAARVAYFVMSEVEADPLPVAELMASRVFLPGGRYLYAAGRPLHQTQNCLLMRAEDSREGWSELLYKCSMGLMTGAGVGIDFSPVRHEGADIKGTGGLATGPISLANIINEAGRRIMQGGSRRSALWGGLVWNHPDIIKWIEAKNWSPELRKLKEKDFNFPCPLDGMNISVILDDAFFDAINDKTDPQYAHALKVYQAVVRQMLQTGEPGFSVDCGKNAGESLRNACTEITSHDDSDICNLGSIVLSQIESPEHMAMVTRTSTEFLLAGTVYSHVPYEQVDVIRKKNRRLGLGLMGVSEWLFKAGHGYEPCEDLATLLDEYKKSGKYAKVKAREWKLSEPLKTRAIAPTGTIAIIAECTSGLEPPYAVAYKRRYLKHQTWFYQYHVDPSAKRLIEEHGVKPEAIEDAFTLAANPERRIAFQAWIQQWVDHGISSTVNLPAWGSELNNSDKVLDFSIMLLKYLPKLRGITAYPDGARGGQPLVPVKYSTAVKHGPTERQEDVCNLSKGGSCGD